ncbi:hypothetical protein E2C01_068989 [Portunus trituberculatus]|uniref:Uncharacterized protein n=1 Tax=Portunus trituberculatus TaxID=210409 RepID=A0A5B7HNX4_PORTR|nr:hypothetical protein [Portunus trituberculatus]
MDPTPSRVQMGLSGMGCTSGGPVCYGFKSPATTVCVSTSGPERLETGRVCLPLGGLRSVRFPPFSLIRRVLVRPWLSLLGILRVTGFNAQFGLSGSTCGGPGTVVLGAHDCL